MRQASALTAAVAAIAAVALLHERAFSVQRLQRQVDGLAVRASMAIADGRPVEEEVRQALVRLNLPPGYAAVVERPLRPAPFPGSRASVRVTVTAPARSRLLPAAWGGTYTIRSAAAALPPPPAGGRPAFIRVE